MMTVRTRLWGVLARWWLFERKLSPTGESRLSMRCWWSDCDINRHMNNSRYLALMDVGRYHFILRSGLLAELWRRRWFPVLVRAEVDFKRSIKPGERFVLETAYERVGTKSAVLRQRFRVEGEIVAEALVTGLFLHRGRAQELRPMFDLYPHLAPEPSEPRSEAVPVPS